MRLVNLVFQEDSNATAVNVYQSHTCVISWGIVKMTPMKIGVVSNVMLITVNKTTGSCIIQELLHI